MKSFRGAVGVKMRGKLEARMGCSCCVAKNLKKAELFRLAAKEVLDFKKESVMKRKSKESHKLQGV